MFDLNALRRGCAGVVVGLALAAPAYAQKPLDWVLGGLPPKAAPGEKLIFRISETAGLELLPREDGSTPNQHPQKIDPAVLRQQLLLLQLETPKGEIEPLFGEDEATDISGPLARALAAAKPNQDVGLLSSSRRGGFLMMPPLAMSARLFFANDRLNVIVAQPRIDYYGAWRVNTGIRPNVVLGSRNAPSAVRLQAPSGLLARADWGAVPLAAAAPAATVPAAPVNQPYNAQPAPAAVAPVVVAPAAVPQAAPAPAPAPAVTTDPEQRLRTLKRLRDNGLISEDEYNQKKAEILKTL